MSSLNKGLGIGAIIGLLWTVQPPANAADTPEQAAANPNAIVVAVVNGEKLSQADFINFVNSRLGPQARQVNLNQQQMNVLFAEYINRELIFQDAVKKGLDKAPEVTSAIENQRRTIVAGYAVRQIINAPISDDELEKAYKRLMSKPTKEYKTRHILVSSEAAAQQVIAALDKGTPFEQAAKENSIDKPTADKGGDIGWVSADQMMPALRDAVIELKKGSYTKKPVKTDFGWHIVRVDDMRIIPAPSFDDAKVKEELRRQLHNESVNNYIAQLRKAAQVEVK
jgi:peptidyl-prolyl cis-trans isomerase C